jgi:hypothetical protein
MKSFLQFGFITFTLLFLSQCKRTNPEPEKIDNIEFSYYAGLRIPYNEIVINLERNKDQTLVIVHSKPLHSDSKWNYSKIDTVYFTEVTTFDTMAKSLVLLDKIDLDKAAVSGLDGYTCKIEYGAKGKHKSYQFWCPTTATQKRGLTDFLSICEQILVLSKINKQEVLE